MKKVFSTVVAFLLLLSLIGSYTVNVCAEEFPVLSEMTTATQIEFLEQRGVEVPGGEVNYEYWGPFISDCIALVESDPAYMFRYNWTVSQDFAMAIQAAVNDYYGIVPDFLAKLHIRSVENTLQHSTVLGEWNSAFVQYNCYAFAINKTDSSYYPGYFYGNPLPNSLSLEDIARRIIQDLKTSTFGNICVQLSRTEESAVLINNVICVRLSSNNTDYHFMRRSGMEWHHKPGPYHTLSFLHSDASFCYWTNESVDEYGAYVGGDITYSSEIYYFRARTSHSYTDDIIYTGSHYHLGAFHFYEIKRWCQWCESYIDGVSKKSCSGPPCEVSFAGIDVLPPENQN